MCLQAGFIFVLHSFGDAFEKFEFGSLFLRRTEIGLGGVAWIRASWYGW